MPAIKAAETACRTSRPPWKDDDDDDDGGGEGEGGEEGGGSGSGSGSPRSMKTSQTRSWAGKGME